jgi:hypothetical protein
MVSVVKRPQGHKLIDQAIAALISESYEGDALAEFPYHSLTTGAFVYIESDIDEYNGFHYVTVVTPGSFKISEYEGAPFVEYYQDADIDYYQTQEHDWSSIFLPIVYKLTNTLWPTNIEDAIRTVSSSSDDNGYTNLVLSGPLKATFNALEFVKVGTEVYQIVEVISTSQIVINLPYDASNTFTTAQYYYNNYQSHIKIFAGLPASHYWEHKKPFEEVAELSLTPDENNEVMFSISDYIQSKVKIENNLTLYSLPLNLDAFSGFYISNGESYDQSDNYSLYTSESTFADDDFVGYAITGKLPFKNLYSGDYAEYVYTSGSPAKWLTSFERPLGVEGYFFDISFIKNISGPFHITINKYLSDYAIQEVVQYEDFGIGVYRIPLTLDSAYDSFCIQAATESHMEDVIVPPTPFDLSLFLDSASGDPWTTGIPEPFILNSHNSSVLYISFPTSIGVPYRFNYKFRVENVSLGSKTIAIATFDAGIGGITFELLPITSNGIYEGYVILTPSANGLYVGFNNALSAVPFDWYAMEFSEGEPTTEQVEVPGETVTEEICIDILEACEVESGFIPEGRRLTEDGGFRLLE